MFFSSSNSTTETRKSEVYLNPVERERLSPSEFIETVNRRSEDIRTTSYVPPKLGDDHFGYFEVEYDSPVYK